MSSLTNSIIQIVITQNIKYFSKEYFPLNYNYRYYFDYNLGDTVSKIDSVEDQRIISYNSSGISNIQKLQIMEDRIYLIETKSSAFLFFNSEIEYSIPAIRLPFPVKIGDSWQWNGKEITGDDTTRLTINGEIIGEEIIQNNAGEFKCLKIR